MCYIEARICQKILSDCWLKICAISWIVKLLAVWDLGDGYMNIKCKFLLNLSYVYILTWSGEENESKANSGK